MYLVFSMLQQLNTSCLIVMFDETAKSSKKKWIYLSQNEKVEQSQVIYVKFGEIFLTFLTSIHQTLSVL